MLNAMLVTSAVLPMAGRPARITRSDACRPPKGAVHVDETGRDARQLSLALVGSGRHVDGVGEGFGKALETTIVAAGFGQFVETALGFLDLVAR